MEFQAADGTTVRLDTTLRYTTAFRVEGRNAVLLSNPNNDDGDRDFSAGLVSNRGDLLEDFDIARDDFGLHASGDGWFDSVYQQSNANNSPATFNPISVPHNQFTKSVQTLEGRSAELLDAYVHGTFDIDEMPLSFRLGRQTLQWGESLFFAENGITAGQGPIDSIKALSEPLAEAKEVFLPVTQLSMSFQPRPWLGIEAYWQFEWRKTRFPGVGSYFSAFDYLDAGGERYFVAPGEYLLRTKDKTPNGADQYGVAIHLSGNRFDYGLYALRFNAKEPELAFQPGAITGDGVLGTYNLQYQRGIELYGASVSGVVNGANMGAEISARRNMPLVSRLPILDFTNPANNVLYPVGDTLHAQASMVARLRPIQFWDSADLSAEIAANDRLSITSGRSAMAPGRDPFAAAFRAVLEPHYFRVLPGLDLSVPMGLGIGIIGNSSVFPEQNEGAGDIDIGITAVYRAVWRSRLMFTHFLGRPERQPFADRDFIALTVERTF
jgi:Protein of unknown function (DUF1302)